MSKRPNVPDPIEWTQVRASMAILLSGVASRNADSWTLRQWEDFIDGQLCATQPFAALREHLSTPMTWRADCDEAEFNRRVDAYLAAQPFMSGAQQ